MPRAVALAVALAYLVVLCHAQKFNIRVGTDELELVKDSEVNRLLTAPKDVAGLPVPGNVDGIDLSVWALSGSTYVLDVASSKPDVVVPTYSLAASGTLPTAPTPVALEFNCSSDGETLVTTTWNITHAGSGNFTSLKYYFYKQCSSIDSECAACGPCITDGTCSCDFTPTGSVCSTTTLPSSKETAQAVWGGDDVVLGSWNLFGVANAGETAAQTLARFEEIGDILAAGNANILCLQEAFQSAPTAALVRKLQGRLPNLARQTFGDGPSQVSGLFFASQFPILEQSFEEFSVSVPGSSDALTDKGVFGALVEISSTHKAYVFNTHVQAGGGSRTKTVQLAQLRQIRNFIQRRFTSAASKYASNEIAVYLLGDLNTGTPDADAGSSQVSYSEMIDALSGRDGDEPPRDLYLENNPEYSRSLGNCTEALRAQLVAFGVPACTLGSDYQRRGRIDFTLSFDKVAGFQTRAVVVKASAREVPLSTKGNGLGQEPDTDAMSDHPLFTVTSDVSAGPGGLIALIVVIVLLLALGVVLGLVLTGRLRVPLPPGAAVYLRQTKILLRKNWKLSVRNKRALWAQVSVPLVFMLLLFGLQFALRNNARRAEAISVRETSPIEPLRSIPRCVVGPLGRPCYSFGYTPSGDALIDALMEDVRVANNIPASEVISLKNETVADEWLDTEENRNTTQGLYHLKPTFGLDGSGNRIITKLEYTIQYNNTEYRTRQVRVLPLEYVVAPMTAALARAVIGKQFTLNTGRAAGDGFVVNTIKFPHPELLTVDVVGRNGPAFFLGCLMFNFVTQLGQIVAEKEMHLRSALTTMGMKSSVYWFTWLVINMFWNFVSASLLCIFGVIFQFDYFLKNDPRTYIFLFVLFGFAMVPFAFFCSMFLSRSRTATSFGFAMYLLAVIIQGVSGLLFDEQDTTLAIVVRDVLSFMPFATLAKGMQDLGSFSDNEEDGGLRWSEIDSYAWFPLGSVLTWMIVSFFTFLCLTFAVDYLFSSAGGDSRFRRFVCRCGRAAAGADETQEGEEEEVGRKAVLAEEASVKAGTKDYAITIKGLRKVYKGTRCGVPAGKGFVAVRGTWLGIQDKQLFCLLGHNGAGKTTTLSMATGLLNTSSGSVNVFGHDLHTDLNGIRQIMGVCPQHDVLWANLSAREHIEMFAGLKGVPEAMMEKEINTRLREVSLLGVQNNFSSTFSGGMKRRLSLSISLTGNPKVVYLDEPTTGMDPVSRREIWDLLEREKRRRLIILTTHSMEEADVLGDKIAIMKRGRIRCVGTSLSLKREFGRQDAFSLTLVTEPKITATSSVEVEEVAAQGKDAQPSSEQEAEAKPTGDGDAAEAGLDAAEAEAKAEEAEAVPASLPASAEERTARALALVQRLAPAARKVALNPAFISYKLPEQALPQLTEVLQAVEQAGPSHGITDAQVGLTSLEDVFLAVTGEAEHAEVAVDVTQQAGAEGISSAAALTSQAMVPKQFNIRSQLTAMAAKSFLLQSRRKRSMLFQILLPFILIFLLFLLQLLVTDTIQDIQGSEYIEGVRHPPLLPSVFLIPAIGFNPQTDCPDSMASAIADNGPGEWLYAVDSAATIDLPLGAYGPPVPGDTSQFWSAGVSYNGAPRSGLLGNFSRNVADMIAVQGETDPRRGNLQVFCLTRPAITPLGLTATNSKEDIESILFNEWGERSREAGLVFHDLDMGSGVFNVSILYNATLTQGLDLPNIIAVLGKAINRQLGVNGAQLPELQMKGTRFQPTLRIKVDFDLISLIGPNFYIFLYQLLFPVVFAALVYEKEFMLREIMKMMGLKTYVYWTVTYIFSVFLYMLTTLCFETLAYLLDFAFFVRNDFGIVVLLSFLYGNCIIAGAFLLSAFFNSSKTATVLGYCAVFACGILSVTLIAPFFDSPDTAPAVLFFIQLVPPFALHRGLMGLRDAVAFNNPGMTWADLSDPDVFVDDAMWFLAVLTLVFLLLAAYCEMVVPSSIGVKEHPLFFLRASWWRHACGKEKRKATLGSEPRAPPTPRGSITPAHTSVKAERERVWGGDKAADAIRILDLRVEYPAVGPGAPPKVAVAGLALGVPIGECFGLLGPNGSGKSSSINCLCGYQVPTAGTARMIGLDIHDDIDLIHLSLGVCPQDNVLWDELSGPEHLRFYGRLKDLSGKKLEDEVTLRLQQVELNDVRQRPVGAYSGGMKRRLCVAIAIMGSPSMVLLDEPSTGLDPSARRTLWRVISTVKKSCALVLTTHSMEEADVLCDRVGIVVNGEMANIGSPARLKSEVGDFYKLTTIVEAGREADVEAFILQLVPEASLLVEPLGGTRHYRIPRSSEQAKLSILINQLDSHWAELGISDWACATVSLEEVFLATMGNTKRIGEVATAAEEEDATAAREV